MYPKHWGLRESPFCGRFDEQFFHQSSTHEEGLARLHFLVENRRRLGLLMGPAGSGKSLLMAYFAEQMRRTGRMAAAIELSGLEPAEWLSQAAAGLKLNPDPATPTALLWRMLNDRIAEFQYQAIETVFLFDDADRAEPGVFDQIARLARYHNGPAARLMIVLSGRQERMGRIGPELLELADLRIDLEAWNRDQTEEYLAQSLDRAGCRTAIFTESAVERLQELTHGIPRRVSQVADLALLAGAGQDLEQIDEQVVESVYHELGAMV
jgi:general secretion pathway protein A